ncbi:Putative membrane protein, clustering with ActP [plant metagenome]|uniref:Membrane protein, clustering with ActP n=2 Tax=root TaxID=1 RepID=A0A1C3K0U7_9BURK|nr:DUF485 domain-containing protein [Orrella dioscoreae]SBT25121.1 Putative membrane protein, clustering with ActP [Orrella dioscoreae]SOE50787.1 Putative membrane protein, clustering with ActP [Orrella dioscoreae]
MTTPDTVEAVLRNPKYHELVRRRTRTSLGFFAVTLVVYAGFLLTLAFDPTLFARPIAEGYTISVGVLSAFLVAVSAVVLIALYVYISNKVFDPLVAAVRGERE